MKVAITKTVEVHSNSLSKLSPKPLLQEFIAAGDGAEDLALAYKHYLSEALSNKLSVAIGDKSEIKKAD